MAITLSSVCSVLSLSMFVAMVALFGREPPEDEPMRRHLEDVHAGLIREEEKVTMPVDPLKVAVGFGASEEVSVNGLSLLAEVGGRPPVTRAHNVEEIHTLQDLENIFGYYFQHGAAAERFIHNETLFEELVEAGRKLQGTKVSLGGNAPTMARRFHRETGSEILLAATMSSKRRKEIEEHITVAGLELQEDVHLVMEYPAEAKWGKHQASRANRFIFHHDHHNPYLKSLEAFPREIKTYVPDLIVLGGLQALDKYPFKAGEREINMVRLQAMLSASPRQTLHHLELASFAEHHCFEDILKKVIYYMDSIGANEQELPNLHSILTNGSTTLISDPYPRISTMLDYMRTVYRFLRETRESSGRRRITRLHIHTLAYQAIITTKGSVWKDTKAAAAKASLTATRHNCGHEQIDTTNTKLMMQDSFLTSREAGARRVPFDADDPVTCWAEEDFELCLAPNLVCTKMRHTGGAGDNISAAALAAQVG